MTVRITKQAQLSFTCDAEDDVEWIVRGIRLHERFNQPYSLRIELRTLDLSAEPVLMLGANATLTIERDEGHQRDIRAIVAAVEDGKTKGDSLCVHLTLTPALQALQFRRNSRIFSEQSVVDVLTDVLEAGLAPYGRSIDTANVTSDYPVREYIVQYQETDFDFVHRLMEEYGISYRFDHSDDKEVLVLLDNENGYFDLSSLGNESGVLLMDNNDADGDDSEVVRRLVRKTQLRSTVARTTLFDWLAPIDLVDYENSDTNGFDVPDGSADGPEREDFIHVEPATSLGYQSAGLDDGQARNQLMLHRRVHQRDALTFVGRSTATQISPGAKFDLLNHPQDDLNAGYLITEVRHEAGSMIDGDHPHQSFVNRFECVPESVDWRPERKTARPRIAGVQTATVVGPSGEEIHTDAHGRIKVQFHWDRRKLYDEGASCFIRVVQTWAGNGWGSMFLPRIGMEVAVTFLDGDPDRPVVTGTLYNGANEPPYALPGNMTKSTIKSNSSPGGEGFNELRFEDAAGSEEIYVHAQKDYNEEVLHDHATTVGNNQSNTVTVDQTQTIHGNQVEVVDINQDLTVSGNRTVTVTGAFTETIDGGETRTITGGQTETVTGATTLTHHGAVTETIDAGETRTITGGQTETVTGATTLNYHGAVTETIDTAYNLTVTAGFNITAPGGLNVTAPGGINIIDPAATTQTKSSDWTTAGFAGSAIGFTFGLIGSKVDIVPGLAMSMIGFKIDITGMCIDLCKVKYDNTPMKFSDVKTKIEKALVIIDFSDLKIEF